MQAELDGREPPQVNKRTVTAKDKPPPPLWFAIWNPRHNFARAADAYPDGLIPRIRALKTAQQQAGDCPGRPAASYQPCRGQPGKLPMAPGIRCRTGFLTLEHIQRRDK
jgi:hypothetical protein